MNALVPINPTSNVEAYRASTDAADLCREIVVASAMEIQKRKYIKVEGWQAIAIAHGCTGSARDVERVDGGVRAIGEIRRMSDGALIAQAEGFVGEDEPTWFGGTVETEEWTGPKGSRRKTGNMVTKELPKRPDYAIRAMAQTRAISRACRSAFAHVVVMMNAGLSTTPFEEVPEGGFDDRDDAPRAAPAGRVTSVEPDLGAEMDACKSQQALLAWEQFRLKEIGKLRGPRADELAAKFRKLMAELPEKSSASELSADDVPEFA